jgi:hypothetical protein
MDTTSARRQLKSPFFLNARELAKENPETFTCPNDRDCERLKVGDQVKVSNGRERFWVTLTAIGDGGVLRGKCDNNLVCTDGSELELGDEFQFATLNIYDIWGFPDELKS